MPHDTRPGRFKVLVGTHTQVIPPASGRPAGETTFQKNQIFSATGDEAAMCRHSPTKFEEQ